MMNNHDTTRILELLASKICHDLISPVGAISNGLEIMEEMGDDGGDEVISLISYSSAQASAKLKAMRMVYGLGGGEDSIKLEDVHKTFGDFIDGESRITQNWDPYLEHNVDQRKGLAKMVLASMMMCIDALPRGGEISVSSEGDALIIRGEGDNAHFKDGYVDSLNHSVSSVDEIDPKLIHPYVSALLARSYNFEIQTETSADRIISLRLTVSNVS